MTESYRLMTVGDLKRVLADVRDEISVSIVLPPGTATSESLTIFLSARVQYTGGPVLKLLPASADRRPIVVSESFEIAGRGVAVFLDRFGDWGVGENFEVCITSPDGTELTSRASVEFVRRSHPNPHELPVLLIHSASAATVPMGSTIVPAKHSNRFGK